MSNEEHALKTAPIEADPAVAAYEQYQWVVRSLAAKLSRGDSCLQEDLQQVGYMELTKTARGFKPGKQALASLAYERIRQRMLNFLSRDAGDEADTVWLHEPIGPHKDECGIPLLRSEVLADLSPNADEQMLQDERDAQIRAAVDGLSPSDRTLVQMVFFDGFSQEEAAQALGLGSMAVSRQMARALKHLKPRLEKVLA